MSLALPKEHREENLKLSADPYVDLYKIVLRNGSNIFIKNGDSINWNGNFWESLPIKFEGWERKSEEEVSRPTVVVVNPEGVFSRIVLDGDMDKADFYRYRVLRRDIDEDRPIFQVQKWILWNAIAINTNYITFELRNPLDGNNMMVPARQYYPPEFPTVTLQ